MATALTQPEPMNAITYHSKLRTTLKFADPLFVAGDAVSGKMEMECKTDKGLGIGIIMAELFAIEELSSRDHSATQTFMHSRRVFQGPGLPPSNSVHPFPMPDEPSLPVNYYHARRGTTTFLFRFPLPETSPSAINFGSGIAQLRYEVRATVGIIYKGERVLVTDRKVVDVVEMYREDPARPLPEGVIVGENGKILIQGKMLGDVLVAGQPACVELLVKNHSSKKNTGLTVSLTRDLRLAGVTSAEKPPLQLSDTLTSVPFRGPEFIIQPGVEGIANLVFDIPAQARSLKGGLREGGEDGRESNHLFEVRSTVTVCLALGFGSKDIYLELPVTILHPAAVPQLSYDPYPSDPRPYSPMNNIPPESFYPALPSLSPQPNMPPFYNYGLPPVSPPLPFVDQGRVWLPTLSPGPYAGLYGATAPAPYLPYPSGYGPPQQVFPVRPSSAEPIPSQSFYPSPSGLPPSAVQQALIPVQTGSSHAVERVAGKGERASRTSHHLRMSSRNRSVSPPSHRYAPPTIENPAGPLLQTQTPPLHQRDSSQGTAVNISPGAHVNPSSDVASPRPMPSPKQTYTVDPFTHLTFSKSERVEALERIAAQTNNVNKDMSGSVPDLALDLEKTLPAPPVPSQKTHVDSEPALALTDIFSPPVEMDSNTTPPTPTLAAVTSSKASRAALNQSGGLDALEARLLAEVGTRKVEQDSRRPDVRSVLPINIPRPDAAIDSAIDSAISSLSLPGLGADEGTLRLGEGSYHAEASERGGSRVNEDGSNVTLEMPSPPRESEKRIRKKKSEQRAHGEVIKDKEQHRLRKAAQGRVAAWLGSISPEAPPHTTASPLEELRQLPPEDSHSLVLQPEPESKSTTSPHVPEKSPIKADEEFAGTEQPVDAKPNPRSSGFMPIRSHDDKTNDSAKLSSPKVERQRLVPVWPRGLQDPEARYDVRSARGGRGGKVTAVAAIWAAQTGSQPILAPVAKATPPPPKRLTSWNKGSSTPSPLSQQSPPNINKHHSPATTPSSPAADLAARRAKMAKSPSVPAILSSSLATPMLSSTASLARPFPQVNLKPVTFPPTIQEAQEVRTSPAEPKSSSRKELAFGQARLRELIKKYQS